MQLYSHLSPFLALSTNAHARMMILPEVLINWSFQGWGKLVCNRSQESFYALFDNGVWESLWWCLCGCTMDKNRDGHPYAIAHDVIVSTWWEKFSHKTGIFCQKRYRVRQYHCRALKNSIPSRNNNEKITLAPPSNYTCKMVPGYHKWVSFQLVSDLCSLQKQPFLSIKSKNLNVSRIGKTPNSSL